MTDQLQGQSPAPEKKSVGRTKFSPAEQELVMNQIADLYFKGMRQSEVAAEISKRNKEKDPDKTITQQLVSYYLKKLQKRWQTESSMKIDAAKARELAKIDNLERTYWKSWDKSVTKKNPTGDHRFLEGVQWCIKQRRDALGLDAPKRIVQDGVVVHIDDWSKLTLEQIDRIRRGEHPINVLSPDQYRTEASKK